jgi:acetyltransferase
MSNVDALFNPRSVALIGASSDPFKYGYWTAKSLVENRFKGDLYFVSKTKSEEIFGKKPYAKIGDIEGPVDLAIIGVSPKYILDAITQCAEKNVAAIIIVATGFGETGHKGKEIEKKILNIARKHSMRVMGPNCMGMYNADLNLNTSIIDLAPGPLSLVLQSGNLAIDINFNAKMRNLGYSKWATIGNQVDLRFHDYINFIKDDPKTRVLLLYIEGLFVESEDDGRKFFEVTKKASQKMPIVAIKIGRSAAGIRAAVSHTGSLAGSERVFSEALDQCGVIRVDNPSELLDIAEAFSKCTLPSGNRIAILTDGGGHGVMATDVADRFGLQVPILTKSTQTKLREVLKPHCPIKNPVDLAGTPEADIWVFDRSLKILLEDSTIDAVVIVGLYGGYADLSEDFRVLETEVAKSMVQRAKASGKPVTMHSIYQPSGPECLRILSDNGIPVYSKIESALHAMGALFKYKLNRERLNMEPKYEPIKLPRNCQSKAKKLIDEILVSGRKYLLENEARIILEYYGFVIPQYEVVKSKEEALLSFQRMNCPIAMKILSPDIIHKSDAGGIKLNIKTKNEIRIAYDEIIKNANNFKENCEISGILITPMQNYGTECIIGTKWNSTFGPAVVFGLGGVFVEILKDFSLRLAPVSKKVALDMIKEIKGYPILKGTRGTTPSNLSDLAESLVMLSILATEISEIREIDINPIFVSDKGIAVADARIMLK